jgi:hypothetical protein
VVVRIGAQPMSWFSDEEHVMAQARRVGVPTVLSGASSPVGAGAAVTATPPRVSTSTNSVLGNARYPPAVLWLRIR